MTVKSSARVGYLNAILAQGGGNLNNSLFKSSNARGLPGGGGGGMLMFRIDRRITVEAMFNGAYSISITCYHGHINIPITSTTSNIYRKSRNSAYIRLGPISRLSPELLKVYVIQSFPPK